MQAVLIRHGLVAMPLPRTARQMISLTLLPRFPYTFLCSRNDMACLVMGVVSGVCFLLVYRTKIVCCCRGSSCYCCYA